MKKVCQQNLRLKFNIFYVFVVFIVRFVSEYTAKFADVLGKCYIVCSDNINGSEAEWCNKGPHRFYFREAYDPKNKAFIEPSLKALAIGMAGKV